MDNISAAASDQAIELDFRSIPTLPQSLIDLLDACDDPDVDIHEIAAMVARDATLASRILQLANSAFLGARTTFVDINQAVVYLGIDTVRNLAISVSVHEAFRDSSEEPVIAPETFWYHSLLTALLAKLFAEVTRYANPAEAYLAGLLHDLGKLLIERAHRQRYGTIHAAAPDPDQLVVLEQQQFGLNHAQASARLVRSWRLQDRIGDAIELHHVPMQHNCAPPSLAELIAVANSLCCFPPEGDDTCHFDSALGLPAETLVRCYREAEQLVAAIASAMGIKVTPGLPHQTVLPARNTAPQELQQRVKAHVSLHGTLDNLLAATTWDRLLQVLEEGLQLLGGCAGTLLLSPGGSGGPYVAHSATLGQLRTLASDEKILPATSLEPILALGAAPQLLTGEQIVTEPFAPLAPLLSALGFTSLLLCVVPVAGFAPALLLCLDPGRELAAASREKGSFGYLIRHLGARLTLEALQQRHVRESAARQQETAEQIARTISHELLSPLGAIQNYVALLSRETTAAKQLQTLKTVTAEIERLTSIARRLENLSAPLPVNIACTPLGDLVQDTISLFSQSLGQEQRVSIRAALQNDTRELKVPADMVRQLLTILLNNSLEALPNGGRITISSATIDAGEQDPAPWLRLSVTDNGPGIPASLATSLFRAGVTSKQDGHLGLGLSIATKILRDHGGSLHHERPSSGGARFCAEFPQFPC